MIKMIVWFASAAALTCAAVAAEVPATQPLAVDDFDSPQSRSRWSFSNGPEFPGATGTLEWSDDGHRGRAGRLAFDFRGGGNYVSAIVQTPGAPQAAAIRLWVRKPRGSQLKLRYTDQTGQTFQRSFSAPDEQWADVEIGIGDWEGHWGGANDGVMHGPSKTLAFLVNNSGRLRGSVMLDDVRLIPGLPSPDAGMRRNSYTVTRFAPADQWSLHPQGAAAESKLDGNKWHYDFTGGAKNIVVGPPDRCLLGTPRRFVLRLRGSAAGHHLHIQFRSHFMFFGRDLGDIRGDGKERQIAFDAPPGPGWYHFSGENDGQLHGPLRIEGLQLIGNGKPDVGDLELIDLRVEASYPPQRAIVLEPAMRDTGAGPRFTAHVRSIGDEAKKVVVHVNVRDWAGGVVFSDKQEVTVGGDSQSSEITLPVPTGTFTFLECEFAAEAPDEVVEPVQAYWVSPLKDIGDAAPRSDSPFGMGVYLYRHDNSPVGLAEMQRVAEMAQAAGVKWSREEFHWARIEPRRGKYDWSFYDRLVETAARRGIAVYGILAYWSGYTKPYTEEGIADYCRFAAAAASRYKGKVTHWEVWNEPNIFFWQGSREMYATLLGRAYDAIKAANPDAVVLGCSTSGVDMKFVRTTIQNGGKFDVLTIHPYRGSLDDLGFVAAMRDVAKAVAPRPVWITEMGWATHVQHNSMPDSFPSTTGREQASLLARAYIDAIGSGAIANVSWYDFRNDGDDPFNVENNMGVMLCDLSPKPAYRAYATMTRILSGRPKAQVLDVGPDIVAYRFTKADGGDPLTAIWTADADRTIDWPAPRPVVVTDLMGQQQVLTPENGRVKLMLRCEVPLFVGER